MNTDSDFQLIAESLQGRRPFGRRKSVVKATNASSTRLLSCLRLLSSPHSAARSAALQANPSASNVSESVLIRVNPCESVVTTRREFLMIVAATAALVPKPLLASQNLRFGYAAITWQGKDLDAIREISELGFPGIQLRSPILKEYGDKPAALKEILDKHKLLMVALSSGGIRIEPEREKEEYELHTRNARFVKDVGGLYLQVTDTRPKRDLTPADYKRLGEMMTEIGKRTADLGIPLGYHNHMNAIGERPDEVKWVLEAADPRYVKLELDIAHYQQGGGDPVKAIHDYKDRLLFLHIKDVESRAPTPGATGEEASSYRFVELGRGRVDLKGVFKALADVNFKGWAVVELDRVPDNARTAKESAVICRRFLEELGYKIEA